MSGRLEARLERRPWSRDLIRAAREFFDHRMVDWGAAMTFYAVLSLVPAVTIIIALLGFVGEDVTGAIRERLLDAGVTDGRQFAAQLLEAASDTDAAGVALIIAGGVALWAASGYVGGFLRASEVIHERPHWSLLRRRPFQVAVTLALVLGLTLVSLAVIVTGPIAEEVLGALGFSDFNTLWDIAKWPLLALIVLAVVLSLYWSAPEARGKSLGRLLPGALVAVATWAVASAGFAVYVSELASYNELYGGLAGLIVFLAWLWLTNMALLYGAVLNKVREASPES
ncbi:YihY/virulence factor BrkB family protein [Thermoleophilia bacterium SCSIO 60948]|nr:YihY/virulence factor BrkB family protein [Thermoleophilia bacterium SCSIO 60948]